MKIIGRVPKTTYRKENFMKKILYGFLLTLVAIIAIPNVSATTIADNNWNKIVETMKTKLNKDLGELGAEISATFNSTDNQLVVSVTGDSLEEAIKEAYRLSDGVKFEGAYRRSDIGQKALMALR